MSRGLHIYFTLAAVISFTTGSPLGLFLSAESQEPGDVTVYETQNVYGTYAERQRDVALREGIKPLVDTLQEEQKYGNTGWSVGHALLGKTQQLSAAVSNAVDFPNQGKQLSSKALTAALNRVGGRLLGLE